MSADLETLLSRVEALDTKWQSILDAWSRSPANESGPYLCGWAAVGERLLKSHREMARMLRKAMALPERWSADAWFIERSIQKCDAPETLTDTEAIALDDCADDLRLALTPDADEAADAKEPAAIRCVGCGHLLDEHAWAASMRLRVSDPRECGHCDCPDFVHPGLSKDGVR